MLGLSSCAFDEMGVEAATPTYIYRNRSEGCWGIDGMWHNDPIGCRHPGVRVFVRPPFHGHYRGPYRRRTFYYGNIYRNRRGHR